MLSILEFNNKTENEKFKHRHTYLAKTKDEWYILWNQKGNKISGIKLTSPAESIMRLTIFKYRILGHSSHQNTGLDKICLLVNCLLFR